MHATVTILMATRNGQAFLKEQVQSIDRQSWPDIDLIVSDDGSADMTLDIASACAREWKKGRFEIVDGPHAGFAENFRSLILNEDVTGDYVAFSDQDDIWKPDKLLKAVEALSRAEAGQPALYCGRTEFYPQGDDKKMSPLFNKPTSFRNALVQSIAGGNTMVMNRAAFEFLRESVRRTGFISHDWWAYLIITGCGGKVIYSAEPDVHYRQHGSNLVGANNTFPARVARFRMLLNGRFKHWTDTNLAGLDLCLDMLTPKARSQLDAFRNVRQKSIFSRLAAIGKSGVYRQTINGQIGLYMACALRLL